MTPTTKHYLAALGLAVAIASLVGSRFAYGLWFWLLLMTGFLSLGLFLRYVVQEFTELSSTALTNATLVFATTFFCMFLAEVGIIATEWLGRDTTALAQTADLPLLVPGSLSASAREAMSNRQGVMVMPDSWVRRRVPDTPADYVWHETLHEHDKNSFRRSEPLPPKTTDTFRVMVVGDSLTYGYGIAASATYTATLQRLLAKHYRIEVLNLGVSGYQSADIADLVKKWLPQLQPDLVIYGVCLNDYLPSGVGIYTGDQYAFPLPDGLKDFLIAKSRLGKLVSDGYNQLLMTAGLRLDFFDDILRDFDSYQTRFRSDVKKIAQQVGPTPLFGIVLHQYPKLGERTHRIVLATEQHLRDGGFTVIDSEPYLEAYVGHAMQVSKWEGHPNELANAIFASMLLPRIESLEALQEFRK